MEAFFTSDFFFNQGAKCDFYLHVYKINKFISI
jgi:hypothetical protein